MAQAVTQTTSVSRYRTAGAAIIPAAPVRTEKRRCRFFRSPSTKSSAKTATSRSRSWRWQPSSSARSPPTSRRARLSCSDSLEHQVFLAFPASFRASFCAPRQGALFFARAVPRSDKRRACARHGDQTDHRPRHRRAAPLHPRRLQRAADARGRRRRRHAHPREPADHQVRDRARRARGPRLAPGPPQGQARPEVLADAGRGARWPSCSAPTSR